MTAPKHQTTARVVLLVQAADDSRGMYVEFLRHHGLEVLCPPTCAEALTLADKADVIVTGILVPGSMDGIEFIRRLHGQPATRDIPIVVLTACAWQTERERAEQAGCDLFLSKPCLPDQLLREVRRLAAGSGRRGARATPGSEESLPRPQIRRQKGSA
jgi:two-component system cell cycle response regulator DivK